MINRAMAMPGVVFAEVMCENISLKRQQLDEMKGTSKLTSSLRWTTHVENVQLRPLAVFVYWFHPYSFI